MRLMINFSSDTMTAIAKLNNIFEVLKTKTKETKQNPQNACSHYLKE